MRPYRTDEFVHKLFYETSRFTAFNSQWVVKARINNNQRDPTQSSERDMTYQVRRDLIFFQRPICFNIWLREQSKSLFNFVADFKNKNNASVTSSLFDIERTVWRHESTTKDSQIWIHRPRKWKPLSTTTFTWHCRVQ